MFPSALQTALPSVTPSISQSYFVLLKYDIVAVGIGFVTPISMQDKLLVTQD